jgi:hypothetical protein
VPDLYLPAQVFVTTSQTTPLYDAPPTPGKASEHTDTGNSKLMQAWGITRQQATLLHKL